MDILIKVVGQKLKASTNQINQLAEGSQKFVKFIFDFDKEWKSLGLTTFYVNFVQNGKGVKDILINGNNASTNSFVYLPPEIKSGECLMYLCGVKIVSNGDKNIVATTSAIKFNLNKHHQIEGSIDTQLYPDEYSQLKRAIDKFVTDLAYNNTVDFIPILEDNSVTKEKLEETVRNSLDKADSAVQPQEFNIAIEEADAKNKDYINNEINALPQTDWRETDDSSKAFLKGKPLKVEENENGTKTIKFVDADGNFDESLKIHNNHLDIDNEPVINSEKPISSNALAVFKEATTNSINNIPQTDWRETDDSSKAFLKGKPFAEKDEVWEIKVNKSETLGISDITKSNVFKQGSMVEQFYAKICDLTKGVLLDDFVKMIISINKDDGSPAEFELSKIEGTNSYASSSQNSIFVIISDEDVGRDISPKVLFNYNNMFWNFPESGVYTHASYNNETKKILCKVGSFTYGKTSVRFIDENGEIDLTQKLNSEHLFVDKEPIEESKNPLSSDAGYKMKLDIEKLQNSLGNTEYLQSDWNQNDDTQADYIKNRPFYEILPFDGEFTVPEYTGEEICTGTYTDHKGYLCKFVKILELSNFDKYIEDYSGLCGFSYDDDISLSLSDAYTENTMARAMVGMEVNSHRLTIVNAHASILTKPILSSENNGYVIVPGGNIQFPEDGIYISVCVDENGKYNEIANYPGLKLLFESIPRQINSKFIPNHSYLLSQAHKVPYLEKKTNILSLDVEELKQTKSGLITTDKIEDGAVTPEKLSEEYVTKSTYSWDELPNKPFYNTQKYDNIHYEYDENSFSTERLYIDGGEELRVKYIKVGDITGSAEEILNEIESTRYVSTSPGLWDEVIEGYFDEDVVVVDSECSVENPVVLTLYGTQFSFTQKGLYVMSIDEAYCDIALAPSDEQVYISDIVFKGEQKRLDEKYMPKSYVSKSYLDDVVNKMPKPDLSNYVTKDELPDISGKMDNFTISEADEGKFLVVKDGQIQLIAIPNVTEGVF